MGVSQVLIVEDDIEFCPDFIAKFNYILNYIPDEWDAVTLNGTDHPQAKAKFYNERLNKCQHTTGAFAILFNGKSIPKVLSLLTEEKKLVDIYYAEAMRHLNWFRPVEKLVLHRVGFSEIKGKFVEYKHLK